LLLLEELGEVLTLRKRDDFAAEVLNIRLKIDGDCSAFVVVRSRDGSANFTVSNLDDISDTELIAANVDDLAVHSYVTVRNQLSSLENCLGKAESPHNGGKPQLKEPKEVEAGIAVHPLRSLEGIAELLFEHVVIAADDLLCKQLFAIFRLPSILQVRSVLA